MTGNQVASLVSLQVHWDQMKGELARTSQRLLE